MKPHGGGEGVANEGRKGTDLLYCTSLSVSHQDFFCNSDLSAYYMMIIVLRFMLMKYCGTRVIKHLQ